MEEMNPYDFGSCEESYQSTNNDTNRLILV